MSARWYFAWRAMQDEIAHEERRKNYKLRQSFSLSRISDTHFTQRYRLTKAAFHHVCSTLREYSDLRSSQRVSLETKVLCALLFYANGDYQRVIGLANYLSQEAVSRYIDQVTMALNHPMVINKYIKFPNTREARDLIKHSFYNSYGIPGVIGCVDGCHFRIFKPEKENEHHFYCRKHYHSLNVQMVCDHECRILSVNAKFGGASHDAFVWENSNINVYMQTLHRNSESVWLLGDSGYPQRPWLMTPYINPEARSPADYYNAAHSRARVLIENTFGRLKNRWRCVCKDRVLHYKPDKCAQIIKACCVLHNIALDFGVPSPQDEINVAPEFHRIEVPPQVEESILTLGRRVRDELARRINNV